MMLQCSTIHGKANLCGKYCSSQRSQKSAERCCCSPPTSVGKPCLWWTLQQPRESHTKKSTNRCCSPPTSIAMLVANTVVAKGVRVLRDVAAFPAEHSGGYMVYAVVHWQMHSVGWEDYVHDCFSLFCRRGSCTPSSEDFSPFIEGGHHYTRSLITMAEIVPT